MDVHNYSDAKGDLVSLLNSAFHKTLQNNICDFAVIKKTSIGKNNFFFLLQNVPEKLQSIFTTLQNALFFCHEFLNLVTQVFFNTSLLQTGVENQKFQQSFVVSLRMTQFHRKCVLVFINFVMKTGICRKVTELRTLGSLRMYLILFNFHFRFEKLQNTCHNDVVVYVFPAIRMSVQSYIVR